MIMHQHKLALEPLGYSDLGAKACVEIAARAGFDHVSMVLHEPAPILPADPIVKDASLRRATIAAMKASGVRMSNIECFNMTSETNVADFAAGLACGHELGALTATAIVMDNPDRTDVLAKYCRLCDMAAELDIRVNIEFFAMAPNMNSLDKAVALARDSGRANAGVTIDVLHLMRTGSSIAAMRAVDPALIGACQISDGMLHVDAKTAAEEGGSNRLVPGTGEFPLRDFLAALPADIVVGVEVPQARLDGTVAPEARAAMLIEAMRGLYRDAI
jgi:sugar phosphate isomerase/epimerase